MKKHTQNQSFEPLFKVGELVPKYVKYIETDFRTVSCSFSAYSLFKEFYDPDQLGYRETFYAMYLNRANQVVGVFKVSEGGVCATLVDCKLIFAQALLVGASSIILSHNHPSGNLNPSEQDIKLTKKIQSGALYLELNIVDHIIITERNYYSFADEGRL
jgi:DNA repair protein RadC